MTRITFLSILIHLSLIVQGQVNLVPNPSFELTSYCPWDLGQLHLAVPWTNTSGGTTPDYFHTCCPPEVVPPDTFPRLGVPENIFGFQNAHTGQGYAGVYAYSWPTEELREYLQIELSQPIQASVPYKVSFYVSLADKFWKAVGTLGAYFTEFVVTNDDWFVLEVNPQVESPTGALFSDKVNWTLVEDTFTSRYGGEKYMLIGNFRRDWESNVVMVDSGLTPNGYNQSYYYIDDVSVIALDSVPNSVEENETNNRQIAVYPNPNNGRMTVSYVLAEGENGILRVHNTVGVLVMEQPLNASQALMEVEMSGIGSGLYLLSIEVNNERKLTERISVIR